MDTPPPKRNEPVMEGPVGKENAPPIGPLSADGLASKDEANPLTEPREFTPAELDQLSEWDDQWREVHQRAKLDPTSPQAHGSSISDQGSTRQTGEEPLDQDSLHDLIKHLNKMRPQAALPHTGIQDPGFSQAGDVKQIALSELSPGAMIGDRYQVMRTLGRGGMGMVYLCRHLAMGHQVAIKLLPADRLQDPAWVSQFASEARVSAAINHPHIVRVFECDNFEGRPFLVMEYVEGVTLERWRRETDPCCPYEVAELIQQAAYALQHAHQCGLIHRDIKPANLMLTRERSMKVLDLGISKLTPQCAACDAGSAIDKSSVPLGTRSFVAPELIAIDREPCEPDARSDIYALGCTWYWLLTRRLPHAYEPNDAELLQHWQDDLYRLKRACPRLPEGMLQLLGEMLHPVRNERIASMENAAINLNRLIHRRPIHTRPVGSKRLLPPGWTWARWIVGIAILGLLAVWPAQVLWKSWLPPHQRLHQELVAVNAGLTLEDVQATWEDGRLVALRLPAAVVKDVSPLASYPSLKELSIQSQANSGQLNDLGPCIHLPLRVLELAGNPLLSNLKPLSGLPIEILNIDRTAIEELPELPQLRMLFAGDSKLRSLESLSLCPGLELLYVENTIIADLQPIAHAPLRNVQLLRTDVRSLAPLQGKPLEYINLSNTQIADLSPLHGAPLEKLTIMFGTKVNSLEPLRGCPIKVLQVENSMVEDWTVLETLPLEELTIDWNIPPSDGLKRILSAHPTLQVINGVSKDRYLLQLNRL